MIIIDASIALKLINTQEEGSDIAAEMLLSHVKGEEKIGVPKLLYIEVANALTTKSQIEEEYIKSGINELYNAKFEQKEVTRDDLIHAALFAKKYRTSVYDMLYAVIAKKERTILITADERFVKRVSFPFVKLLTDIS